LTHTVRSGNGSAEIRTVKDRIRNHREGLARIVQWLTDPDEGAIQSASDVDAVGHRVVHGGQSFHAPARIDDRVMAAIRETVPLAPLHNPANLTGIEVARDMFPSADQVAVFDTAFYHTLPKKAFLYAIPFDLYEHHGIRRYGFHGSSHAYVAEAAAGYLNRSQDTLKIISVHLGNGASVTAIRNGEAVDTSMGMTPLPGLIMGTRSGDIDPSLPLYLARAKGMSLDGIEHLLNRESGLKGLCGTNDLREIVKREKHGDLRAEMALEMYGYRVKKYIGAYVAVLEGLDLLIFTGGIGTHSPDIRTRCCQGLRGLGIELDSGRNRSVDEGIRDISAPGGLTKILVVPTDEELRIAQETLKVLET
jgi:acetate kinase